MGFKIKSIARTAFDPLGVDPLGVNDSIFGKEGGPDYSAQEAARQKALADNQQATDDFVNGGAAHYDVGNQLQNQLQNGTEYDNITSDPAYKAQQQRSLADLQDQATNGLNASDRADLALSNMQVDAANRGRQGAIQQKFQNQGQGGSGLSMIAQMQAAQDANTTEALRALETDAQVQQRKTAASAAAGNLATNLSNTDFSQQAARAAAQDRINQFNTQNSNQTNAQNWDRTNSTSDRNATAGYTYRKDVLGAKQGQNQQNFNAATDSENRARIDDQAAEQRKSGAMGAALGIAGGVVGGIYGGPAGATAGSQVGSGVGQQAGRTAYRNQQGYAHGGKIPGHAPHPGDDPRNDVVGKLLSPGEIVVPRSAADDPMKAAAFVAQTNAKEAPAAPDDPNDDVIAHLMKAMHAMHKGRK